MNMETNTAMELPEEAFDIPENEKDSLGTEVKAAFTGVYIVWLRDVKRFWRDTPRRIGAFVQPLVYLFLLGTGLQAAFKIFGGNVQFIKFMFPGILGMTLLFTSVFSAISILWDREFGFLKEILVSPVPRAGVALGKIVGGATQALMQGVILLILMFFPFMYGFSLNTLGKAFVMLPMALLLALGLTSIGVAIAANMKSMEGYPMIMNLLLLPLFFLSGAMFPLQDLPGWMNFLTKIDPLTYGVDMLRGVALKGVNIGGSSSILSKIPAQTLAQMSSQVKDAVVKAAPHAQLVIQRYPFWLDLVVVAGFGLVMLLIAIWQFSKTA